MPDCYLLAVSKSSALDGPTNNWSLFTLVEQIQVDAEQLPGVMPLEVHVFLRYEPGELGEEFELRLVMVPEQGDETVSKPVSFKAIAPRHRLKINGFQIPGLGNFELRFEWSPKGREVWKREGAFWPVLIETAPSKVMEAAGGN